ncbi:SH3 domain-containing protein, partial [Streptomyces carminius]|uniref:SH3 domain-containing protein n=1 Tax=Streptomyces carminius TaxID=2665496 RepID=UPI0018EBA71F
MRPTVRRLVGSLCALMVVASLPPATAAAADRSARSSWRIDLTSESSDQHNIAHRAGGITVGGAAVRTRSAPGASYAVYTSPTRSLGRQASAFTIRQEAEIPSGTTLLTEVRGSSHPGTWTQWSTVGRDGRVRLPEDVSVLQTRLTFHGRPGGDGAPSVSDLVVRADARQPAAAPPAGAAGATAVTYRLFATREGLVGHTTANGHVIQERDHFVALPSRRMLASNGGHEYRVRLCYKGRCETAPVWDVGPWNTRDDYWNPSAQREMWRDLPQGRPQAQAAYQDGHNGGLDEFGRRVANPAGIDLADGTFWDGLGMTDNDWVDVTFQPEDGGGGGQTTVTAWAQANVRSCASTGCDVVS